MFVVLVEVWAEFNLGSQPRKKLINNVWESNICTTSIQCSVIGNLQIKNAVNAIHIVQHGTILYRFTAVRLCSQFFHQ